MILNILKVLSGVLFPGVFISYRSGNWWYLSYYLSFLSVAAAYLYHSYPLFRMGCSFVWTKLTRSKPRYSAAFIQGKRLITAFEYEGKVYDLILPFDPELANETRDYLFVLNKEDESQKYNLFPGIRPPRPVDIGFDSLEVHKSGDIYKYGANEYPVLP